MKTIPGKVSLGADDVGGVEALAVEHELNRRFALALVQGRVQGVVVNIDLLTVVRNRRTVVVPDWGVVPGVLQVTSIIGAAEDVAGLLVAHLR